MEEPLDIFSDQFQFNLGPYGCVLNFMITDPLPPAEGKSPQNRRLATIRMTVEHLKVMTFLIHQQISLAETRTGVRIEIPDKLLDSLNISREDWDSFWKAHNDG